MGSGRVQYATYFAMAPTCFTLLAMIEPFVVAPLYLATIAGQPESVKKRFAQALAITVTVVLLVSGLRTYCGRFNGKC